MMMVTMNLDNLRHVFQTCSHQLKNNSKSYIASSHFLNTFLEHHKRLKTNVFQALFHKVMISYYNCHRLKIA